MKKVIIIGCVAVGTIFLLTAVAYFQKINTTPTPIGEPLVGIQETDVTQVESIKGNEVTERYSAQVDRVKVIFEHTDYTTYRLQTNDLVRTGDMNTERGYKADIDATVYVLNWQLPEGKQMRYVRLTAEPEYLYGLDSAGEVLRGSRLIREQD